MSAFSLVCLGDVMLGRGVSKILDKEEPEFVWGDTLPVIEDADLRLANLECCISARGRPFEPPRVFYFRAIPKAVDCLTEARIEVVTLANNHVLDYGEEGLLDTLDYLDGAGVAYVGAGIDIARAQQHVIIDAPGGRRVGFIAFTDNYPEYAAGLKRPGTFYLPIDGAKVGMLAERIEMLRRLGADLVVATAHWGPNMRRRPPGNFIEFARAVVDAGADLWFGHSAHIFQGVEYYHGKPIIYDGGDFIDDYAVDEIERNDLSLIWKVRFGERISVEATPVKLEFGYTRIADEVEFQWISEKISELCREMNTTVGVEETVLRIEPP